MKIEESQYSPRLAADRAESAGANEAVIPLALDGARVDRAAAAIFPAYSRARLQAWIEQGALRCNGSVTMRIRDVVREGDRLQLAPPEAIEQSRVEAQAIALNVVYADDAIAVIDKPAGLIVHPGAGAPDGTLQNALLHHFPQTAAVPRAGIVHRLDKDTSGLLVVALSLSAHISLVTAMAARKIRREYEALVNGVITASDSIEAPISRDPRNRLRMAVVPGGRPALTHYKVIDRFQHHTLLRVRLETGRTHQIRVHMAMRKHPIVGDALYGGRAQRGTGLTPQLREALLNFPRQALHARELAFAHPIDGRDCIFESPLPADIVGLLAMLQASRA
jgi:23S rRNA pseudouridine1911/1915/1917 synthase